MGAVSAAGKDVPSTLETFARGERNGGALTVFESPINCPVFEVKNLPPSTSPSDPMRTVQLALIAAREAVHNAGLLLPLTQTGMGVCMGTTVACQLNDVDFYSTFKKKGTAPVTSVTRYLESNLADVVGDTLGATGPRLVVANACSSGTDAMGIALSWLRSGICNIAIAGGSDELNRVPLSGFYSLSVMSPHLCLPFDRDRDGLNLGEGAGMVVLETEEHARERGTKGGIELAAYAAHADAYHLTAPRSDGSSLEAAIRDAISIAGLTPGDIAFVNAHGTATQDNDRVEGRVLARLFGSELNFLSTKGYIGHTLGAAGSLEAVFTATALKEGWIPASAGFVNQDEKIPITPVTGTTEIRGSSALSTSLAFGGSNSALIFRNAEVC